MQIALGSARNGDGDKSIISTWEKDLGKPDHYSIELPQRCLKLINSLWQQVSATYANDDQALGPLTSTFIMSMSMPIISIPLERVERQIHRPEGETYVDDRRINEGIAEAFQSVIRRGQLGDAPFFTEGAWSFCQVPKDELKNIADGFSEELARKLDCKEALESAQRMPASQWISVLRNAMAHGGIAYLDETGRTNSNVPVKMFAFVSGRFGRRICKYADEECPNSMGSLESLNVLRIHEDHYRDFLHQWVDWLEATGLTINRSDPQ